MEERRQGREEDEGEVEVEAIHIISAQEKPQKAQVPLPFITYEAITDSLTGSLWQIYFYFVQHLEFFLNDI